MVVVKLDRLYRFLPMRRLRLRRLRRYMVLLHPVHLVVVIQVGRFLDLQELVD